jgi:PKD repeat protein
MLGVRNQYGADTTHRIFVIPEVVTLPVANFSVDSVSGKVPLTVTYSDTSLNATSWFWDFGDGTSSTEENPVMTYAYAGNYTVKLTASNSDGSDTIIATDFITVLEPAPLVANFTAEPRSGNAPLTVAFNDTSDGDAITLWYWEFGDGTNSSIQNPVHTYSAAGNYSISFEIANSVGSNTITRVDYITVSSPPVTTIPTTVPTTIVTTATTKPTPTRTHTPLSLQMVLIGICVAGMLYIWKNKYRRG